MWEGGYPGTLLRNDPNCVKNCSISYSCSFISVCMCSLKARETKNIQNWHLMACCQDIIWQNIYVMHKSHFNILQHMGNKVKTQITLQCFVNMYQHINWLFAVVVIKTALLKKKKNYLILNKSKLVFISYYYNHSVCLSNKQQMYFSHILHILIPLLIPYWLCLQSILSCLMRPWCNVTFWSCPYLLTTFYQKEFPPPNSCPLKWWIWILVKMRD